MDKLDARIFDHFPQQSKCPLCGGNEDGPCVLIGIQGTQNDGNIEAMPVHIECFGNPKRFLINREVNVIYATIVR